ncbi:MAG: divergent PAP2 family protein [Defluviitaleaceae bacterium]|nr:divergent PAP2 family protein [Defluviitaleaceae bacterium]
MATDPLLDFLSNKIFLTSVVALAIAQVLKALVEYWKTKSWRKALFISTGGMPSSHSALVSALALSMGLRDGFGTPLFAASAVMMMVVMYDAAGVRRAAGKQAEAINFLFEKLIDMDISFDQKLKVLLGHKPIEVAAGAILGLAVAAVSNAFF